jgi:hypothetical protein
MQVSDLVSVEQTAFHNRSAEWDLYRPIAGVTSMLELGNKKNAPYTYKQFFEARGIRHVSVDWNGQDGALSLDLRKPLGLGTFDLVSNIGTSEHVDDQAGVWRNMLEAMHVGSILVCTTPLPGGHDWQWHGEFYPTAQFYGDLCSLNGLQIERIFVAGVEPRRMIFCRARRVQLVAFVMPKNGMYVNVRQ